MLTTDDRLLSELAAINLAKASISKSILETYQPKVDKRVWLKFHAAEHPRGLKHRTSEGWAKADTDFIVVRAHRIFIEIFALNRDYAKDLRVQDLWDWYFTYTQLYPNDDMTPNRLHYMIGMIRANTLRIKECCTTCGKSFVIHQDMFTLTDCAICRRVNTQISEQLL
jgi:hypothetical protein